LTFVELFFANVRKETGLLNFRLSPSEISKNMKQVFSFYREAFNISVQSILEHKLRAFLTLIGIIIGVAAVVVVGASIEGLQTYVMQRVSKMLGTNSFMITRLANVGRISDEEWEKRSRRNKDVTWEEYEYLRDNCKMCVLLGAQMGAGSDINQDGIEMPAVRIMGFTANMVDIEEKTIESGRFFSDMEVEKSAKVCVIGTDIKDKFFPHTDPIGKTIRIRGVTLEIIGIEEKKGSFFGDSMDRTVYIPITLHKQIFNRLGIGVRGKGASSANMAETIENARLTLRNKRQLIGSEDDTFSVVNTDEINNQMSQFTSAIAVVVIPITLIILVVGGIVVMNIMLVSVTERTFEVGLRKALGATRHQIILQFLIESTLLCVIGGLFGLILAVFATQLLTYFLQITMTITVFYMVVSVGISSLIGIIAGLYPAWKAAKLDPIVALTKN
jgi:putative ABC transport system permease protein